MSKIYFKSIKLKKYYHIFLIFIFTFLLSGCLPSERATIKPNIPSPISQWIDVPTKEGYTYFKKDGKIFFGEKTIVSEADIDSFEILGKDSHFARDKRNIYCGGKKVEGADLSSFVFNYLYPYDQNAVYFVCEGKIQGADPSSFKLINNGEGGYAIDKYAIYSAGQKVENIDHDTFQELGFDYYKDKNGVYYLGTLNRSDPETHVNIDIKLKEADPNSFQVLKNSYAKDRTNAYYEGVKIEEADASTFQVVKGYLAKDKNNLYSPHRGTFGKIGSYDGATFEILGDYYKDKNGIYYGTQKITEADPLTFQVFGEFFDVVKEAGPYGKDKRNVYYKGNIIKEADSKTFGLLGNPGGYAKDKNNIYYQSKKIEAEDVKSFELLTSRYAKDKQALYYLGQKIENIDFDSLVLINKPYDENISFGPNYFKDKNAVYENGIKLEGIDPFTFEVLNHRYTRDKNGVYDTINKGKLEFDPLTFKILPVPDFDEYLLDKNGVYWGENKRKIEGADPFTFQVFNRYAKDKNSAYYRWQKLEGAEASSFTWIPNATKDYARDASNVYYEGKKIEGINIDYVEPLEGGEILKDNKAFYKDGAKIKDIKS